MKSFARYLSGMPSKRVKIRKREAITALAKFNGEAWAIDESFCASLIDSVRAMAESGHAPEALTTSSYASSKMQIVGDTAVIPIFGVIRPRPDFWTKYYGGTACEDLQRDFNAVIGNAQIKNIILLCDSPGGSVSQVDETAKLIYESRAIKKITAVTIGMNASACYYISSAASVSVGGPSTMHGSIGVKASHYDWSKAYEEMGLKITEATHGKHKGDLSQHKPLSKSGQATLQKMVDDFGDLFDAAVARHRKTTIASVQQNFGGGRTFLAAEAVELGMIDKVGTLQLTQASQPEQIIAEASAIITAAHESPAAQLPFVSVGVSSIPSSAGPVPSNSIEESNVKRLKAYMFAVGMVSASDASDETVEAVLNGFCSARGETVPVDADGNIDEDKAIKLLQTPGVVTLESTFEPIRTAPAASGGNDQQQVADDAVKAYEKRRRNIEATANLINQSNPNAVTREDIEAAITGSDDTDTIRDRWQSKLTAGNDGATLVVGDIRPGVSGEDAFASAAALSLFNRSGRATSLTAEQRQELRTVGRDIRNMSMIKMAERSLQYAGVATGGMSPLNVAMEALQGSNPGGRTPFYSSMDDFEMSSGGAAGRPGDYANILGNLAGLTLDQAMQRTRVTFGRWSNRLPNAADFRASTFVAIGGYTMLDNIPDGKEFEQLKNSEEYRNYITVDRHGNTVKMTPRMMVDDAAGLDAFVQALTTLGYAHDNTLNDLHLQLLNANPVLPDGKRLFDATRQNWITGGASGPPSKEAAERMKLAHAAQTDVGVEDPLATEPTLALVPTAMETPALQTYAPFGQLPEMKEANVDGELNVHRGSLSDGIVKETKLDSYNADAWYTLDMMIRVFGHQYLEGHGPGGRRNSWFDNNTESRHYSITGIFGVSVFNPRGIVRNDGTGV